MPLAYTGLTGRQGVEDNIGGLTKRWWFAPMSYFTAISAVDDLADDLTVDGLSEITVAHTFAVGKGFHPNYCTRDAGELKFTGAGERDGRSIPGKATLFIPGFNKTNLGQLRMIKNDELMILVELADGKIVQLGTERFPAEVRISEGGSAKNESGVRGFMLEIDAFESGPIIYNTGADPVEHP